MKNQLHQESDIINGTSQKESIGIEKVLLLQSNYSYFNKILKISLLFQVFRIFFFVIIVLFEEMFVSKEIEKNVSDSWSIIFFVVTCLIDFLGTINDITMLRFLKKEVKNLQKVKQDIRQQKTEISQTKAGSYTIYLSLFSMIKRYKYNQAPSSISISQTLRFLHISMTFYIFGNLAVSSQGINNSSAFTTAILWILILSVWISVFQLDFFILESSNGPFIQKDLSINNNQKTDENQMNHNFNSLKDRYIKTCRKPFQITYYVNITLMILIISASQLSLMTFFLIACIFAHLMQLIYETKQHQILRNSDLSILPYKHLNSFLISSFLLKKHPKISMGIKSLTRITMVLVCLAYSRTQHTSLLTTVIFLVLNIMFFASQNIKLTRLQFSQLYVLECCEQSVYLDKQCSICLVPCSKGQQIVKLPCFSEHIFHRVCLKSWLKERKQCPLCRFSLEMYHLE